MRWIILIVMFLVVEAYAYQSIKLVLTNDMYRKLYMLISFLILSYVFYVFYNYDRSIGPTQKTLKASGFLICMFIPKLILSSFMLIEDLVRGFMFFFDFIAANFKKEAYNVILSERRKFISQIALGVSAIPFAGLLHGIFIGKYNYKVIKKVLHFEDLPNSFDGFKVMQISDIHSGSFNNVSKIKYAVDLINKQQVDIILFTGDIVNTLANEMDEWIDIFKSIKTPTFGKYSVLGNHDYGEYVTWENAKKKQENFESIKNIHKKIDFKLLLNDSTFIEKGNDRIALIGVENWGHNFKKAGDLQKATSKISKSDFKIVMSHDPSHWEHEIKNHPYFYHLTLSGHTHGMQFGIEIPGFLRWSPVQYVYKQWAGLYAEFGRYLYVNRGFGYHAFPGRVGIWPEITLLELKKK